MDSPVRQVESESFLFRSLFPNLGPVHVSRFDSHVRQLSTGG